MKTTAHPAESFTGDSTGIHRLVGDVQRNEVPAYACSPALANQALAALVAQQPRRLGPADPASVFAADPRRSATDPVPFLQK
ncbi:hypothetical protein [Streptomyces sp. LN245]|uniref:hypothetical protein n=1 Tax=Streptomyces sp. LN245 TaxID=3112975 RepID=UPI0037241C1E